MSTKQQEIGNVEAVHSRTSFDSPPRKSGGAIKRHCKKWWWLHLIIAVVITLAVTLGLIFGAVPAISQSAINKSTLDVEGIQISNTQNTQYTFGINSTIHGHVPVKSSMSAQNMSMSLVYPNGTVGEPFMYLEVPKQDLKDTIILNIANYPAKVANMAAYIDFTNATLFNEKVTLNVKSRPSINVGSLHNKVDYNKNVEINGFNGLQDTRLSNLKFLNASQEEDGASMEADVIIPNTSSFILEVGDLNMGFNGSIAGAAPLNIGYGIVHNLTLYRGENRAKVRTFSALTRTILEPILPSSMLILFGNTTTNPTTGEHIEWLEIPLSYAALTIPPPNIAT